MNKQADKKQKIEKMKEIYKMTKKAGYQETFTFERENGETQEYLLQHPGVKRGMEIKSDFFNSDTNKIDMNQQREALMKYVIVKPKVNWDYFEEVGLEEADAVLKAATKFLG